MSAWAATMGAGATMGSCMRRLPFHPEDGIGPKCIVLTPEMAKYNSRVGDLAGVQFTLYELTKELKSRGHDIKYGSLIESLRICHRIDLSVYKGDGKIVLEAPIFPILLLGSKKDWLKAPKETRCYVQFHPLITQCISSLSYRQFHFVAYVTQKQPLALAPHTRL